MIFYGFSIHLDILFGEKILEEHTVWVPLDMQSFHVLNGLVVYVC